MAEAHEFQAVAFRFLMDAPQGELGEDLVEAGQTCHDNLKRLIVPLLIESDCQRLASAATASMEASNNACAYARSMVDRHLDMRSGDIQGGKEAVVNAFFELTDAAKEHFRGG